MSKWIRLVGLGLLVAVVVASGVCAAPEPGADDVVRQPASLSVEPFDASLFPFLDETTREPLGGAGVSEVTLSIIPNSFPNIVVNFSVLDGASNSVTGLKASSFRVTERSSTESSGVAETLTCFEESVTPGGLTFCLVFDVSGSMSWDSPTRLTLAKAAATNFLSKCGPSDRGSLVSFSYSSSVRVDYKANWVNSDTNNNGRKDIVDAILKLAATGNTAVYDGTAAGLDTLSQEASPKVVIVFTDGETNDDRKYSLNTLLAKARNMVIPVYTIALGNSIGAQYIQYLKDLAAGSGGQFYRAPTGDQMAAIYAGIAKKVRSSYRLCYSSHNPDFDGSTRLVTLTETNSNASGAGLYVVNYRPAIVLSDATRALSLRSQQDGVGLQIAGVVRDLDAGARGQTNRLALYYRNVNAGTYSQATTTFTGDGSNGVYAFSFTIPGGSVQGPGIQFYLQDGDGVSEICEPFNYDVAPHFIPVLPNTAPAIQHVPVQTALLGTEIAISATVTETNAGDSVRAVTLYYRVVDSAQQRPYFAVTMAHTGGGVYTATVPSNAVTLAGVEYSLSAWDSYGIRADSGSASSPYYVAVGTPPVAGFCATPLVGMRPLLVAFENLTVGRSVTNLAWDFDGDGVVDFQRDPRAAGPDVQVVAAPWSLDMHTYATAGQYTVRLAASGLYGSDTATSNVYIVVTNPAPPRAAFTVTPNSAQLVPGGVVAEFEDGSSGAIDTWAWDLDGDGVPNILTNRSIASRFTYATIAEHAPVLTVTGPGGSATVTGLVSIVAPPSPVARFVPVSTNLVLPATNSYLNQSSGWVTNCLWDFDGDGVVDAQGEAEIASHVYTTAGVYCVGLTVVGPGGGSSSTICGVTVLPPPPVAQFAGAPLSVVEGDAVVFTNQSSGSFGQCVWDFDSDGVADLSTTDRVVSHVYRVPGTYSVKLTVTGAGGSDAMTRTSYVTVNWLPPIANITVLNPVGVEPHTVTFVDSSLGNITSARWDFDSDGTFDMTDAGMLLDVTYRVGCTAETICATLVVSGPGGVSTAKTCVVSVSPRAPVAGFQADVRSGTYPLDVVFTDASTNCIDTWEWDFDGNGVVDLTTNGNGAVTWRYTQESNYTVRLTVRGAGGSDTMTRARYIDVQTPPPVAAFSGAPTTITEGDSVTFSNRSSGVWDSGSWDFDGDGVVDLESAAGSVVHRYQRPGTYSVSLTAVGRGGTHRVTATNLIEVRWARPTAGLEASVTAGASPLRVEFTDVSSGAIDRRFWDFDNDGVMDATNPAAPIVWSFDTVCSFETNRPRLIVEGPGGTATAVTAIVVAPAAPVADFELGPASGVFPLTVYFTNTSANCIDTWKWDFDGDGSADTVADSGAVVSHVYDAVSDYSPRLVVEGPGGTNVRVKANSVSVGYPVPVASFTVSVTNPVSGTAVVFTDTSSGVISAYRWDLDGDGVFEEDDPVVPVTKVYTTAGVAVDVRLEVRGPGGVSTSAVTRIDVLWPAPVADFGLDPVTGVFDLDVTFTNRSAGNISESVWNFGDGVVVTDAAARVVHRYTAAGTYDVGLVVSGPGGTDARTRSGAVVVGWPEPVAALSGLPVTGLVPLTVTFQNVSEGNVTNAVWDFDGDGESDAATNGVGPAEFTYTKGGIYTVALAVHGPGGGSRAVSNAYVTVEWPAPVAAFSATPLTGQAPTCAVVFVDRSSGNVTNLAWDFDGDGETDVSGGGVSARFVYTNAGVYNVSLTAFGPGGSHQVTSNAMVVVIPPPPVAGLVCVPESGIAPLTVTFTNLSHGSITGCVWTFGDGTTFATGGVGVVRHVYGTAGVYTVGLSVSGVGGQNSVWVEDAVRVAWPAPVAALSGTPLSGTAPLEVTFANLSANDVSNSVWDVDGDGVVDYRTAGTQVVRHTYDAGGTYAVALSVAGRGGSDSAVSNAYVQVEWPAPVAKMSAAPTVGQAPGFEVTFVNLSEGNITNVAWDFDNDGTPDSRSVAASVTHTYAVAGTYGVRLVVSGPGGSSAAVSNSWIVVIPPAPTAGFDANPASGVAPLAVVFTNRSSGVYSNATWSFGDGQETTVFNGGSVSHTYAAPGRYDVGLVVRGPGGDGVLTRAGLVTVAWPAPVADFAAGPSSGVMPLLVTFTNLSQGNFTNAVWSFGDGSADVVTLPGQAPNHTYATVGSYTVTLRVNGPGGSDTEVKAGVVVVGWPRPTAAFGATPLIGEVPLQVTFRDQSAGDITNRHWVFGDGTSLDTTNTTVGHLYTNAADFAVSLTVSGLGGADTESKTGFIRAYETNRAPVACAVQQQIYVTSLSQMAVLDASCSSDPEGDPLFFSWRESSANPQQGLIPEGSETLSKLHLYFPIPGRYYYQVKVSDGLAVDKSATVLFTVYVAGMAGQVNVSPSTLVRLPDVKLAAYLSQADAEGGVNAQDIAITDSRGLYALENVTPASQVLKRDYWLRLDRTGFAPSIRQESVSPDPVGNSATNFSLLRGYVASVSGMVVDEAELPVVNALVNLVQGNGGAPLTSSSGGDGTFSIANVPIGTWVMQIWPDVGVTNLQPIIRDVVVYSNMPGLTIRMPTAVRGCKLRGKVTVAGTAVPVVGASVYLGDVGAVPVVTELDGSYETTEIPSGSYVVRVVATGMETLRLPAVQVEGVRRLDMPMYPVGLKLSVTVIDNLSSGPVYRASVTVGMTNAPAAEGVTDRAGYCALLDVPSGTQTVTVIAAGYDVKSFSWPTFVPALQAFQVALTRGSGWQKPLKVRNEDLYAAVATNFIYMTNLMQSVWLDGGPSQGTNLLYVWRESPGNPQQGLLPAGSQISNTVQISGIREPGVYVFELQVDSGGRLSRNTAAVTVFAPGLVGNVHRSPSDKLFGVSKATVRAYTDYNAALTWADGYVESQEAGDNPAGNFYLDHVTTGSYWVVSRSVPPEQGGNGEPGYNQYGPVRKCINYSSAVRDTRINMPVDEVRFGGTVVDSGTGTALRDVRIVVAPGIDTELFRDTTAGDGTFLFTAIPKGNGQVVMMTKEGYRPEVTTLNVTNGTGYRLAMTRNLEGRTAILRGKVTTNYRGVQMPVHHAEIIVGTGLFRTFTDGGGNYEISGLAPGTYYAVVRRPGYVSKPLGQAVGLFQLRAGVNTMNDVLAIKGQGGVIRVFVDPPVPGIAVLLAEPSVPGVFSKQDVRRVLASGGGVLTDQTGGCKLAGIPPGTREVQVVLEDGTVVRKTLNVKGSGSTVVFTGDSNPGNSLPYVTWLGQYFNSMELTDVGLAGNDADPDGDGLGNLGEFIAGCVPTNGGSTFRAVVDRLGPAPAGFVRVTLDNTLTDRVYEIYWKTNLLETDWHSLGLSATGTGSRLILSVTNDHSRRFFRTGVRMMNP